MTASILLYSACSSGFDAPQARTGAWVPDSIRSIGEGGCFARRPSSTLVVYR
jgi:hypothetical protein